MTLEVGTIISLAHVLALAVALGSALAADLLFLFRGVFRPVTVVVVEIAHFLGSMCAGGLAALWLTGIALASWKVATLPEYMLNEKLWTKVFVVAVLTVNAFLVHNVALRRAQKQIGRRLFEGVPLRDRLALAAIGGVSATSWMFATLLGAAKEWSMVVPAHEILAVYYLALVVVVSATACLAALAGTRPRLQTVAART